MTPHRTQLRYRQGMRAFLSCLLILVASAWPARPAPRKAADTGIFLRCTGKTDPREALQAVRSLGLSMVQISKLPDRFYTPEGAREFAALLKETDVHASAVVAVYDGERYTDIPTIRETVGFVPAATLAERVAYTRRCVDFAAALHVPIVTFHVGFLPAQVNDPIYQRVAAAVTEIAGYAAAQGVTISLETGQESAEELLAFLDHLHGANVGVNFDMANLVLYGKDDPPAALRKLLPKVTSVHVKDGRPPADAGKLGAEVRLGDGEAGVKQCLQLLRRAHFQGPVVIENYVFRTTKQDPMEELRLAKQFVERTLSE